MSGNIIIVEHQGKIVTHYRKLNGMSRGRLAELLGVDISTIYRMEKKIVIKDIKRRNLLVGLLGIPAASMGLGVDVHPVAASLALNEDDMNFFESNLEMRWNIYHTGGTTRASQGLDTWLRKVEAFAKEVQSGVWGGRVRALLVSSYQLQGSICRDLMHYEKAHTAYKQSFVAAKELNDKELMASVLARRGVTYIQQQKSVDAIPFLIEALRLTDGIGLPYLRGYIFQALSEAYAMSYQAQNTWRSIELAERALERKGTVLERSNCQSNTTSVMAQKGVDAVLLHDNDRAIVLIDKALIKYDPTLIRGRARLVAQKAEAYYGIGDIEMCTMTATEAWTLACSVGSSKTCARIQNLYGTLKTSVWKKESSVLHLGALLL